MLLTRDRGYRNKPPSSVALYRRYFRQYPKVAEAIANRWRHYNRTRDEVLATTEPATKSLHFRRLARRGSSSPRSCGSVTQNAESIDCRRASMPGGRRCCGTCRRSSASWDADS